MSEAVISSQSAGVLTIALNRPDKLNALNSEMAQALIDALNRAATAAEARVIVLTGTGRGFSAGQDLEEIVELSASAERFSIAEHLRQSYNQVALRLRSIEKPVIAAMNGVSAGVGLSLALACDMRIAADDATFTLGFSRIGLIPDGGASFLLPLLVGLGRAFELAMTSDRIDAAEAYRLGLVNKVFPAAELEAQTAALAQRLMAVPPEGLGLIKRAFNHAILPGFAAWLEEEANLQEEAASGPGLAAGVRAFLEKRPAPAR